MLTDGDTKHAAAENDAPNSLLGRWWHLSQQEWAELPLVCCDYDERHCLVELSRFLID